MVCSGRWEDKMPAAHPSLPSGQMRRGVHPAAAHVLDDVVPRHGCCSTLSVQWNPLGLPTVWVWVWSSQTLIQGAPGVPGAP